MQSKMTRALAIAVALVAALALASVASAARPDKLSYDQARAWSKAEVAAWCEEESACDSWKVATCHRFSRTRVDCGGGILSHRLNRYCFAIVVNKMIAETNRFDSWFRAERCGDLPAAE
ncbi:MAG: hypothetical protein U0R71_00365 [Solirubrobacterales bacterium]